MRCVIEIEMGNAAFEDAQELSRILKQLGSEIFCKATYGSHPLFDVNGNRVGECRFEEEGTPDPGDCLTCGAELHRGDCPVCDEWDEDRFEEEEQ
jgi:hypothetical protein